jgi:N-glycosylase/DNA lyase
LRCVVACILSDAMTAWSDWQPLSVSPPFPPRTLAETLDGGQAFRWNRQPDGPWFGIWGECAARLRMSGEGSLEWSAPAEIAERVAAALPRYLALDVDYTALTDALPWRSDPQLAACLEVWRGLRLLRQPFGETLLCFLCSATKQIVQIKQMVELLAERFGAPVCRAGSPAVSLSNRPNPASLGEGKVGASLVKRVDLNALDALGLAGRGGDKRAYLHRLPTWPELAVASESDLRTCALGFRARFILQTAQFLAAHPGWLDETERLPYAAAKERLCRLPGVGEKIADCVLLFGVGRFEAFPVDGWIVKAMARRYGLSGWMPTQIAHFGRVHFGAGAGLAQQYLFATERAAGRKRLSRIT